MQFTFRPSEIVGMYVPDERKLHRGHVLIPAKISNKSLICLFYKIVIVSETPVDESAFHKL